MFKAFTSMPVDLCAKIAKRIPDKKKFVILENCAKLKFFNVITGQSRTMLRSQLRMLNLSTDYSG